MKTVKIEGEKYDVPDWVNYIVIGVDDSWCGYEYEPWRAKGRMIAIFRKSPTGKKH